MNPGDRIRVADNKISFLRGRNLRVAFFAGGMEPPLPNIVRKKSFPRKAGEPDSGIDARERENKKSPLHEGGKWTDERVAG